VTAVLDEQLIDDRETTPENLYLRWERQNWATQDLAMADDRPGWQALRPFLYQELKAALTELTVGEVAVAKLLTPLVYAAPTQAAQFYLSSQLVDESRHSIFFLGYLRAVEGSTVSPQEYAQHCHDRASRAAAELFDTYLLERTDQVLHAPDDRDAWYAAVTTYHVVAEGALALVVLRSVAEATRRSGALPALAEGIRNVIRDESRHVGFGVWAMRHAVAAGRRAVVADQVLDAVPHVVDVLVGAERRNPSALSAAVRARAHQLRDQWDTALDALLRRLYAAGLDDLANQVTAVWGRAEDRAITEYEDRHGVAHPCRSLA
jgi:ribonucleoside-diphosphate reductase beta chain